MISGNRAAQRFYEATEGENLSAGPSAAEQDFTRRFFQEGRELRPEELPMQKAAAEGIDVRNSELDVLLPSGRTITILGNASPLRDVEGRVRGSIGAFVDITARKQAEESLRDLNATLESKVAERTAELQQRTRQLQKLALELSQAEDRERRRIAVFLHEDLQQQIAGAKFHLSLLNGRTRQDPQQQAVVAKIDETLRGAIEKSRSLSHELSPAVLHQNDLGESLRWLAVQMRARHGLVVHVNGLAEVSLRSDALAVFLFVRRRRCCSTWSATPGHGRRGPGGRRGRYVRLSVTDQDAVSTPRGSASRRDSGCWASASGASCSGAA